MRKTQKMLFKGLITKRPGAEAYLMTKKTINPSQIKLLWGKSLARCAMCKLKLIKSREDGKEYPVGVMAHINGEKPGSARYNSNMTIEERSSYENLILLCPTHHEIIDKHYLNKHPDTQFAERLKAGFVKKYEDLCKKGFEADALFYELLDFASDYSGDFKQTTAGLSVLAYFFEKCDVFEE